MEPRPPENSIVCGYITDSQTNEPLKWSAIQLEWLDVQGHIWRNSTSTNNQGFYSIYSSTGEIYLYVNKQGYCYEKTYRIDAMKNELSWKNFSLDKDLIQVDIIKPLRAIYSLNYRFMPFFKAVIIGGIEIDVLVHDYQYSPNFNDVEKVEFYIDNNLKSTVTSPPYSWMWRLGGVIKHSHSIKVIAYDNEGNIASDEINIWKFI